MWSHIATPEARGFYAAADLFAVWILSMGMSYLQSTGDGEKAVYAQEAHRPKKRRQLTHRQSLAFSLLR
jgi:hypothetical protein